MEISKDIHQIPDVVANIYLLIDVDGLVLVDCGMPGSDKKVVRYVDSLGRSIAELKHILVTHADADHVGSLHALQRASRAVTYASAVESQAIAGGWMSRELKLSGLGRLLFSLVGAIYKVHPANVDEIVVQGQVLPIMGGIRVIETPGHTPGHLSFLIEKNSVLFCGDSFRSAEDGLEVSQGMNTWDERLAWESARLQAQLGAHIVCAGHGPVVFNPEAQMQELIHRRDIH